MKKTFSSIVALLTGLLLIVTSCSNASQVVFEDKANQNINEDGLSIVSIKVGDESTHRSFFPNPWETATKSNLLYVLTGTKQSAASPTVPTDKNCNVFTWEEIDSGKAIINLEPIEWDLTLTAYQPTPEGLKSKTPGDKKVMSCNMQHQDLTSGGKKIVFNLQSILSDTQATGDYNIQVKFFDEPNVALQDAKIELIAGDSDKISPNELISSDTFAIIGNDGVIKKKSIQKNGKLAAGNYKLKVTFRNKTTVPQTVLVYEEPFMIEGGNITNAIIDIPAKTFGRSPVQPTRLDSSVAYDYGSDEDTIELVTGRKIRQFADNTTAEPSGITKTYDLTYTWKDNSYNESGFELLLITDAVPGAGPSYTDTITIKASGDAGITVTGTGTHEITPGDKIKYKAGSLGAGSNTITITVPTSLIITKSEIKAVNNFVTAENKVIPCVSEKKAGMFTVLYSMKDYVSNKTGYIQYKDSSVSKWQTTKPWIIEAYDINTVSMDSLLNKTNEYPTLAMGGDYIFKGWKKKDSGEFNNPTLNAQFVNAGELQKGVDLVVYPVWTVPVTLDVTFPDYGKLKDCTVVADPKTVIEAKSTDTFTITATETIDGGATGDYKFRINAADGSNTVKFSNFTSAQDCNGITASGNVLSWNNTDAKLPNGDYSVYIEYNFTPNGGTPYAIGGTIFVRIMK